MFFFIMKTISDKKMYDCCVNEKCKMYDLLI